MHVISASPLRTGSILWRAAAERWTQTVVVKATYTLAPGTSALAAEQEDVGEHDNHWDDDPRRSVYAPSDRAPFKRRADVILVGHAFAPQGKPVRSVLVRLSVGELDKVIEVVGPRFFTRDGAIREGPRWTRMPLLYERAAGGPETWNPVGISPDAPPDTYGQAALPNLQPPRHTVASRADFIPPVGFGPIAARWPTRRQRLRQHAATFHDERLADAPLPDDLDPMYFQVAPADQQLDALEADQRIVLENLHPAHQRLVTNLSGHRPVAFVDLLTGAPPAELPLVADTLWINTDRARCTLAWRGQLTLGRRDQRGRVVVALAEPGERLDWAAAKAALDHLSALEKAPREQTLSEPNGREIRAALPFSPQLGSMHLAQPSSRPPPRPEGPRTTVEVTVPQNIATLPPWLAAKMESPPSPSPPPVAATPAPPAVVAPPAPSVAAPPRPVSFAAPAPVAVAPTALTMGQRITVDREKGLDEDADKLPANATLVSAAAESTAAAGTEGAAPLADADAGAPAEEQEEPTPARPLELVWFDPAEVARVRRTEAFEPFLKPPPRRPPAPKKDAPPAPESKEASEAAQRDDLAGVLAKAEPAGEDDLLGLVAEALAEGSSLIPSLAVVAGELELPFDDVELLEATASAAAPLASADKKLKEVLDLVAEVKKSDLGGATELVAGLVARVREAWTAANKLFPPAHIEEQPARTLLERRKYQKRELLDGKFIRALLHMGADEPVPVYLPDALSKRLPLFRRFAARAVVEVLPQQDQFEAHPIALRAVALARALSLKRRR